MVTLFTRAKPTSSPNSTNSFNYTPMSGKLIILEGPDCSGKTTLAEQLMELGFVYFHGTHLGSSATIVQYARFHESMLADIKKNLEFGHNVVVDRHWPSHLCYNNSGGIDSFFTNEEGYAEGYGKKMDEIVRSLGGMYVFCLTDKCLELHAANVDPDHPYDDGFFRQVYQRYKSLYLAMSKRKDVVLYDFTQHAKTSNELNHFISYLLA